MMASHIVRSFADEVRNGGEYGLIADETADISQIEQLIICLRIVKSDLSLEEFFSVFMPWKNVVLIHSIWQ